MTYYITVTSVNGVIIKSTEPTPSEYDALCGLAIDMGADLDHNRLDDFVYALKITGRVQKGAFLYQIITVHT